MPYSAIASDIVSTATVRHLRGSAQKARLVVDLIRGKKVGEAQWILASTKKYAAFHVKKLLDSSVANAIDRNPDINPDGLYIHTAFVNEGLRMKRVRPAPQGRAHRIQKRTCHITLKLGMEE
jgi:large subunit ribosomal protein L22